MFILAVRPSMAETTALGAAMAAGFAEGIKVWDLTKESPETIISDVFRPSISEDGKSKLSPGANMFILIYQLVERDVRYAKWKMAVERSLGWSTQHPKKMPGT
jgi:glycerol kinase